MNRSFPIDIAVKILLMMVLTLAVIFVPNIFEVDIEDADVVVYRSKKCKCVGNWVDHLKDNGFSVAIRKVMLIRSVRKENGIPSGFSSCHTAIAGKYFIEGHVPAESISTLIKYQPDIVGIALPGRIDQDNPEEIEMGFPEEVIYFSSDGLYKPFDERIF